MENNDIETRDRIINATKELLEEFKDIEKITVRKIAEHANVGIGLINYHFKTRDNLLTIAIGDLMASMALLLAKTEQSSDIDPVHKLEVMLQELYSMGEQYDRYMRFMLPQVVTNGDLQTSLYIVPVLREIFKDTKSEIELRIIALQIIIPLQVVSINHSSFSMYSGIDLQNKGQRDQFINSLINNLVK